MRYPVSFRQSKTPVGGTDESVPYNWDRYCLFTFPFNVLSRHQESGLVPPLTSAGGKGAYRIGPHTIQLKTSIAAVRITPTATPITARTFPAHLSHTS